MQMVGDADVVVIREEGMYLSSKSMHLCHEHSVDPANPMCPAELPLAHPAGTDIGGDY